MSKKGALAFIDAELAEQIREFLRKIWGGDDVEDMIPDFIERAILFALRAPEFREFYIRGRIRSS